MNIVERAARAAWKPADRRAPWQWCEENIVVDSTSPLPGKWKSENSPWVREIMEVFADNRVSDISAMCSAQSSKTQTIMNLMAWAASEDPGPAMWVMAAADEARTFTKNRLWPTLMAVPEIAKQLRSEDVTTLEMNLPAMPIVVNGANSPSKLQSKPIRWLFLDEVRNYPEGALEMVLKRTRSFWNARRVIISTPGLAKDSVHLAFLEGDQRHLYITCPKCAQEQELIFKQLKYDANDVTKPSGIWNFEEMAKTIRYECSAGCGHEWRDTPAERRQISNSCRWIRHNPNAPRHRVSFTWNALIPTWVRWRDVVEEFIMAKRALAYGDIEKLKAFFNETLGLPWEDRLGESEDEMKELEARKRPYKLREQWPDQKRVFMAADVQADHLWYVVRAFGDVGHSRLIDCGKVWNFDELRAKQLELGVDSGDVMIDSGAFTSRVYKACADFGWKPMKGDETSYYSAIVNNKRVRRVWTKSKVDVGIGTSDQGKRLLPLYIWSNPGVKDILALLVRGITSKDWTIAEDTPAFYFSHNTAEKRMEVVTPKNEVRFEWVKLRKDDHTRDCELMILVAAMITKIVGAPSAEQLMAESEGEKTEEQPALTA